MTTVALSRIVDQQASVLPLLMEIGRDATHASVVPDKRALFDIGKNQLNARANTTEIRTAIDGLAHAIKWQSENCIFDREEFLLGMFRALQRGEFPAPVLGEATERLIASQEWFPASATVLATCREVLAEMKRGLQRIEDECEKLEAPARALRKLLEQEAQTIEDETDPMAEFKRYRADRALARRMARQERVNEIAVRIRWIEDQLALLAWTGFRLNNKEAEQRVQKRLKAALAAAFEERTAEELLLSECPL